MHQTEYTAQLVVIDGIVMAAKQRAAKHKHIPQRSCVVCRQVCPKRDLRRLVISPETGIQIDTTGKAPGRGAYLCSNLACWEEAVHSEVLSKALRTTLTKQDRERLSAYVTQLAPHLQPNHD